MRCRTEAACAADSAGRPRWPRACSRSPAGASRCAARSRPSRPPPRRRRRRRPRPAPGGNRCTGKFATRHGCYVFYHDFELDRADPLFAELEALPEQVFEELRMPPGNTVVQVFLFDTQERYERYMKGKYANLPPRRAYFIAEPRLGGGPGDLKVFTWMGDHLRTDLRHELTHAMLHGVLKDVPLWLDEGLAGFFELPPERRRGEPAAPGRAPPRPTSSRTWPGWRSSTKVKQMEKPEYREAWAWVHLMLRGRPEARAVLHEYLQALRTNPNPGPLLPRLREAVGDPEAALADHLASLEAPRRPIRPRAAMPR